MEGCRNSKFKRKDSRAKMDNLLEEAILWPDDVIQGSKKEIYHGSFEDPKPISVPESLYTLYGQCVPLSGTYGTPHSD